jgi:hypothetical protein
MAKVVALEGKTARKTLRFVHFLVATAGGLRHPKRSRKYHLRAGGFDAAFLAVGAHIGKRAYIPAGSAAKIIDAVSLLRSMEGEDTPQLGRRVVIYGGDNTALDAARTAKRLGATEAIIVYRRTRDRMPAHDFEVEEALQEGIMMKWLSTIKRMNEGVLTIEKTQRLSIGIVRNAAHVMVQCYPALAARWRMHKFHIGQSVLLSLR